MALNRKKKITVAFAALAVSLGVLGTSWYFAGEVKKKQTRIVYAMQNQNQTIEQQVLAQEAIWTVARRDVARERASEGRRNLKTIAQWEETKKAMSRDGLVVTDAPLNPGQADGQAPHPVLETRLIETKISFGGKPSSESTVAALMKWLPQLDRDFGGCGRVSLALGLPSTGGVPLPGFREGSECVYRFNLIENK